MASKEKPPSPKKPKVLEEEIRTLLEQKLDDAELRQRLEELASEEAFNGLTHLWGPELYRRNRAMFRPFILNHFAVSFQVEWTFTAVKWKPHADVLDPWLEEVDRRNDVELFRRLYAWKYPQTEWGGVDEKHWRADLLAAFRTARQRFERNQVLSKFDMAGPTLDEKTALALYEIDPAAVRSFLLKHQSLEGRWDPKARKLPETLMEAARRHNDDELYFALYRLMVPQKQWEKDTAALAEEIEDPGRLVQELERRHPSETYGHDLSGGFYALAQARGRDVVPYILKHLDTLWSYYGQKSKQSKLRDHAREQGWWDLWSVLVRKGENDQYNKEVLALAEDESQPDEVIFHRLVMLSGASGEWNWGRFAWQHVQQLTDRAALALYRRFPDLVRGPFRKHVVGFGWSSDHLPKFTDEVLKTDDHLLIDHLTSQAVRTGVYGYLAEKLAKPMGRLLKYYQKVRSDPVAFARRTASVLGQIPAYAIGSHYRRLIESNELVRLFFVESCPALLDDPRSVRDLLEAAEIQGQMLALRVLSQDDDRARRMAADNLDLLLPTLLRPMHRKSRLVALRALANAAGTTESARVIAERARQVLALPEEGYPREHLLSLLAELCHRWPELRGPKEQPVIYHSRIRPTEARP